MATIFLSAGEASGDSVGSELVKELKSMGFNGEFFAVGGRKLSDAGCEIVCNSTTWGVMGLFQAIKVVPKVLIQFLKLKKWMKNHKPDLLIAIDFGYFNVRLCKFAKGLGSKVLYFMPPGSWKKEFQGTDLPKVTDKIATPFEWSADLLNKMGADAEWVGHPILQMVTESPNKERNLIAILPGSRHHEIINNLPPIARSFDKIKLPSHLRIKLVAAQTVSEEFLRIEWTKHSSVPIEISLQPASIVLSESVASIVCSGTATLESAVCNCPLIVIYKVDKIMNLEHKLRRLRLKYIALPSIILDKEVAPELLQENATPENIAAQFSKILTNTKARNQQLEDFKQIRQALGPNNAITRTAKIAVDMMGTK